MPIAWGLKDVSSSILDKLLGVLDNPNVKATADAFDQASKTMPPQLGAVAALPSVLYKLPRYLKLLEQFKPASKLLDNPLVVKALAEFGQDEKVVGNLSRWSPTTWLHGASKPYGELQATGITKELSDPNVGLGLHLGASWDTSGQFARPPDPTLFTANVHAANPAGFHSEDALRYALNKYAGKGHYDIMELPTAERQDAVLNMTEDLLNKGHDSILYGNTHESWRGSPAAIVPFPSKQLEITGRYPVNTRSNLPVGADWIRDVWLPKLRVEDLLREQGQSTPVPQSLIDVFRGR